MLTTISSDILKVTIDTFGAELHSVKDCNDTEYLWQADEKVWKRHAPILFPWTGKLPGGTFTHGGKTYKLAERNMLFPTTASPVTANSSFFMQRKAPLNSTLATVMKRSEFTPINSDFTQITPLKAMH